MNETERLCKAYGLQFKDCGNGHIQISNHGVLINYWPDSKRRTAHIAGGESYSRMAPYDVVKLCLENARAGAKPDKKRISKNPPQVNTRPQRSQRPPPRHLYNGEKPPWEYPGPIIRCWSDIWRQEAFDLRERAAMLENPEFYQDPEA